MNGLDMRNITTGLEIPTITYSDQPYIVKTDDGAWLCCVTTGVGREGEPGQIVTTLRSTDQGRSWSEPVLVEPADGPEASWAVMLKIPGGRVFIFYIHNTDNLREIVADPGPWFPNGTCKRVDSLGYFVFKTSDDGGRTWSGARHAIPMREMDIDRKNPYGGKIRYFWNVGKPFIHAGAAFVSVHKVGGFGEGFFTRSEGVLLKSPNLLTEPDPEKIAWETLPDGEFGLGTPPGGGPIAEEQSYVTLSDGSFYAVYRSIDGHPVNAYSRDGGHTWTTPQYKQYANGRLMKHPRAANFAWKCENGRYLYWFHNHGGRFIREHANRRTIAYEDRNPVWVSGGVEVDTPQGRVIQWSQPEILLYDDDPYIRMSYPDLIEEGGVYYFSETQKDKARTHMVDPALLEGLWDQFSGSPTQVVAAGLVLNLPKQDLAAPLKTALPRLPDFLKRDAQRADYGTKDLRQGFSIDLWLRLDALDGGQVLLDNRTPEGKGFCVQTTAGGALEIVLNDGRTENRWDCDAGELHAGADQHVVIIVDGGPKLILFVVDGVLNDGGNARQFGWGRFNPHYRGPNGADVLQVGGSLKGQILALRVYNRALRVSEAVRNYRAGR
jgi:hypothetical protein